MEHQAAVCPVLQKLAEGEILFQEPVIHPGQTSACRGLTGLFLIALHVGSSHTSLNLLLFQKLHQAQLLGKEEMQQKEPSRSQEHALGAVSVSS